jgi:hypothetical protein
LQEKHVSGDFLPEAPLARRQRPARFPAMIFKPTTRTRHSEMLLLCARIGYSPHGNS